MLHTHEVTGSSPVVSTKRICVTVAHRTLTPFAGVRIPHPLPEKNGNRDTITVLFSYIRLAASYIGYASYICFASDIGLRPVLEANII